MANTNPETLQDLQDVINTLVANDADTPDTDDDEWDTRLNLIYLAIRNWGNSKDIYWNELWKTFSSGVATLAGATSVALTDLTDFRLLPPGKSYLRITLNGSTGYIPFIKPQQAQEYIDGGNKAAYITGSQQAGFTLNLTFTPAAGDGVYGGTFAFDYYKHPFKPTDPAHKVEMSDPNYIVYWVAAQKGILESQNNKFSVYDSLATESMDNMVIMNDLSGGEIENTDALDGAILGE